MNFEKYKKHLFSKIKEQLSGWFDSREEAPIPNQEVYRFLHSIKGTAGTLELGGLLQVSEDLLSLLDENSGKIWCRSELKTFLFKLMELVYDYEHFEEGEKKENTIKHSEAPLIQIIDDDISMLILLKDVLEQQGWMVITNNDPEKAVHQYFEMEPDVLVLDINLPYKDGFQVLRDIQQHNEKYFVPKVMISVTHDNETRIKAFKMGADDFVEKPIEMDLFLAKLERHLQRKRLFDQSVLIDELTQVYNRRFMEESLPKYFQEFDRTGVPFSICVLDIDLFKQVNDRFGHLMGDKVLCEFASFLKNGIRSSDAVFRYGGEEFVLYMPGTTNEQAETRVSELIRRFSQQKFTHKEKTFSVTFSAGIFTVKEKGLSPDWVFKAADHALYTAKQNGRARVKTAQPKGTGFTQKRLNVSVIDDDVIIRTILSQILQAIKIDGLQMNIEVFEDGLTFLASEHYKENLEHFLILDGIMPVIDGLEVLQKVKEGRNGYHFTTLMLTGRKSENDIARALKLGADDYVTKPFSITELKARIERLLKRVVS